MLIKPFFLFFYVLVAVRFSTRRGIFKSLFRTCASAIGANKEVKFFISTLSKVESAGMPTNLPGTGFLHVNEVLRNLSTFCHRAVAHTAKVQIIDSLYDHPMHVM